MLLSNFNYWIEAARAELRQSAAAPNQAERRFCVSMAAGYVTAALINANKMQDRARKALCMRVLNWLRADLRRAVQP